MEKHVQDLKNLLIEIQRDKSGKLLKEVKSQSQRINLSELAEEVLMEIDPSYVKYKEYASEKENRIKRSLNNWTGDKGAWDRQKYENIGDYEERVTKADARLDILKNYIKEEIKKIGSELLKINGIKNLDNDSKKEMIVVMSGKLESIAKKMLETLSVYPFEWDFYDDNLSKGLSKL